MQFNKIPRDLDVFNAYMFRLGPNRFAPKVGEIRTKNTVSILNVLHSDGVIGDKLFTYHPLELSVSRIAHHPLKPSSFLCLGNVMLGMTFEVFPNSVHQHVIDVTVLFGCVLVVEPFFTRLEFHHSFLGVHFENTVTVPTVIGYPVFALD